MFKGFVSKKNVLNMFHILLFLLNVFFLDRKPRKCAKYHGDKHLNKMVTEYAQILSSVWHILYFDCQGTEGEDVHDQKDAHDEKQHYDEIKRSIYKKSHEKHPMVLWASKSLAHYNYVCDLGLALQQEKEVRIDNMQNLPAKQRKKWKNFHKSIPVIQFCKDNPPPFHLFVHKNDWLDPPKCMPEYLHNDENGIPFDVLESYRIFYSGNKVQIAKLRWEPYAKTPKFVARCQKYIQTRPDILSGIESDKQKKEQELQRGRANREKKRQKNRESQESTPTKTPTKTRTKTTLTKKAKVVKKSIKRERESGEVQPMDFANDLEMNAWIDQQMALIQEKTDVKKIKTI